MKILICSDGSEQAERAVRLGAVIAAGCNAEAKLLAISETPGESKEFLDSLKRAQGIFADKKVNVELITKSGNPVEEILDLQGYPQRQISVHLHLPPDDEG